MKPLAGRRAAVLAAVVTASGCGLIDPDIGAFALKVPERPVTVDTSEWELTSMSEVPSRDCSDEPAVCSQAVMEVCGADYCFGSCNGSTCDATVLISLWHTFDLQKSNEEFARLEDQPVVDVTVDEVRYTVSENTFNVDSPELPIYIAPQTVMNPGSPEAKLVGSIPPVPAASKVEDAEVMISPDGHQNLETFMGDFRTPFNIIIGGQVALSAGDPVPRGRLKAVLDVSATASP